MYLYLPFLLKLHHNKRIIILDFSFSFETKSDRESFNIVLIDINSNQTKIIYSQIFDKKYGSQTRRLIFPHKPNLILNQKESKY